MKSSTHASAAREHATYVAPFAQDEGKGFARSTSDVDLSALSAVGDGKRFERKRGKKY